MKEEKPHPVAPQRLCLLLVEDSEAEATLLVRLIRKSGYNVDYRRVETADAMREALATAAFDLVISDYEMPTFSGPEALKVFKTIGTDIPFIVVTGKVGEETAVEMVRAGADDYLLKGNLVRLPHAIQRVLQESALRRESVLGQRRMMAILEAERDLAYAVLRASSLQQVLDQVLDNVLLIPGIDAGGIYLFEEPSKALVLQAVRGLQDEFIEAVRLVPVDSERMQILDAGKPVFRRTADLPPHDITEHEREGLRFIAVIPLHAQGRTVACLNAGSHEVEDLSPEGRIALEVMGNHLGEILMRFKAENERRQAARHFEKADRVQALSAIVAGAAHAINNPTHQIMLNVPILEDIWGDARTVLDACAKEQGDVSLAGMPYAEVCEQVPVLLAGLLAGAERIKAVVASLKRFASASAGVLQPETVDVNDVVKTAVSLSDTWLKTSTRNLVVHAGAVKPVHGHLQRLVQVVLNLLRNACQALPSPDRMVRVTTGFDPAGRNVWIRVEDEGCGMTDEVVGRVFDFMFTTRQDKGAAGLGLPVAQAIVSEYGGRIDLTSRPGEGTIVTIYIPVLESAGKGL